VTTRARGVPGLILALVFLAGTLHAVSYAFTFPPWAIEDEQQHVDYVWRLANDHRLPTLDDQIDDSIIDGVVKADRWDAYGLSPPGEPTADAMGLEARSYTAYHPPLGYVALAPVAMVAGDDPTTVLYALRLAMAAAAGGVCLLAAMLAARWQGPGPRQAAVALGTGLTVAALPALAESGGRVNTDILAAVAVLAGTLVTLRWLDRPTANRAWSVGAVLAAATLTRETTIVLAVPVLIAALVVHGRAELRRADMARMVGPPVVAGAAWAVMTRIATGRFDGSEAFLQRYVSPLPAATGDRFASGINAGRVLLPFGRWAVPLVVLLAVPVVITVGLVLAGRAGRAVPVAMAVGVLIAQTLVLAVQVNRGLNVVTARLMLPSYPLLIAAAVVGWATVRRWTATFVPALAAAALGLWFFVVDFVTRFPPRIG